MEASGFGQDRVVSCAIPRALSQIEPSFLEGLRLAVWIPVGSRNDNGIIGRCGCPSAQKRNLASKRRSENVISRVRLLKNSDRPSSNVARVPDPFQDEERAKRHFLVTEAYSSSLVQPLDKIVVRGLTQSILARSTPGPKKPQPTMRLRLN